MPTFRFCSPWRIPLLGQRLTSSVQTGSSLAPRLAADLLSHAQFPGFLPEPALHSSGSPPGPMPCVGLLPEDVEPLPQPYPFEGYFKSKFRSSGGGILSPEEQDDCLDIIRFLKKEEKPHPAFPFSCTENKRKKPPVSPVSSWQAAGLPASEEKGSGKMSPRQLRTYFWQNSWWRTCWQRVASPPHRGGGAIFVAWAPGSGLHRNRSDLLGGPLMEKRVEAPGELHCCPPRKLPFRTGEKISSVWSKPGTRTGRRDPMKAGCSHFIISKKPLRQRSPVVE